MDRKFLNIIKETYQKLDPPIWENGLLRIKGSGHTWEVSELLEVHPGRNSASVYVLGKLLDDLDKEHGLEILSAIEALQVSDTDNPRCGAFRWYREETQPIDTNAAFFTLLPLAVARNYEPDLLSPEEKNTIDRMLKRSCSWFSHECKNPIFFYTNKIISDGAMLTAIGKLTGDDNIISQSRVFLNKWLEYTEQRGFGWGENLSPGYNGVTIQAFTVIKSALADTKEDNLLVNRLNKIEKGIIETFRFNNGYELVPAIRSYNVKGYLKLPSVIYNLAQVEGFGIADSMHALNNNDLDKLSNLSRAMIIYGDRLYLDESDYIRKGYSNRQSYPGFRETHVMDTVKACTWIGNNGGLGSLNKFPVIEGSYQHKGWGLGWQCFPVSAIVYENQVSFLRFNVDDGEKMRHHPHKDKHTAYLDPALFSETHYPDVKTSCRQEKNTLIAIRSIEKLRNRAKSISDSFDVQRFTGEIHEFKIKERQWIALSCDNACICMTPLMGVKEGTCEPTEGYLEIKKEGADVRLVQQMYKGELKTLYNDRISTGWIFHFIDREMETKDIRKYLKDFFISEKSLPDGLVPRMPEWNIHTIDVSYRNKMLIAMKHDPYK